MIGPGGAVLVMAATKPVDFRKGAQGLAALVREVIHDDPFCGIVYVFRAKRVPHAAGQALGEVKLPLDVAQQPDTPIRRQPTAVECDDHFLAANRWKRKGQKVIFVHGAALHDRVVDPASASESCMQSTTYATSAGSNPASS